MIFGRPEATRVNGWYGSIEDVQTGKCQMTRWEVLNLARVRLDSSLQHEGKWYHPQGLIGPSVLPGFYDRKRHWHSSTASYVIDLAVEQIVFHYLMFSVIDQCKLTTTIFLYHLTYCSVLETALVQVLPPKEPDQVCQSLATINKVRTLKFS